MWNPFRKRDTPVVALFRPQTMLGFGFSSVRALCRRCGWQRPIGCTGQKNEIRAVIRVVPCSDPCNLVSARTRYYPVKTPLSTITADLPGYRDLEDEAMQKGLVGMLHEFQPLFEGRRCPRCKQSGQLSLDQIVTLGQDPRY
jgi:hypothetical protein